MQRWNFKHILIYIALILMISIYSVVITKITINQDILQLYQKFLFAVPILFIIAAFLAFKIAETGIVLIALSFLILSLSQSLMLFDFGSVFGLLLSLEIWHRFFKILPLILPLTLSILFLIPEKIGSLSMNMFKLILALFPFMFIFFPEYFESFLLKDLHYGRFVIPLPSLAASLIPLVGPHLYRDRKTGTFSAALSSALILFMLPIMISLDGYLKETCYLFAGMILLHSLYRVYWENSYIDELTGLFNRRALDERLRRLRSGYSLSMVDIDHFKIFNDTYGHDEGDNVLRLVSRILDMYFGKYVFRYGGEEFCVVFLKTDAKSAAVDVDEARSAIEENMFSIRQKVKNRKKSERKKSGRGVKKVKLTISAGIAEAGKTRHDALSVLKNADKALYSAKEGGRNRVEIG